MVWSLFKSFKQILRTPNNNMTETPINIANCQIIYRLGTKATTNKVINPPAANQMVIKLDIKNSITNERAVSKPHTQSQIIQPPKNNISMQIKNVKQIFTCFDKI